MRFAFHKMHGLGNDFVIIDARTQPVAVDQTLARGIADRNRGIGCDQLILLEASDRAALRMRIFNPDGGEVQACGNATRCVAHLIGGALTIETAGGLLAASALDGAVTVDMGLPRFEWGDIPLAYPIDTSRMPVGWEGLEQPAAVNVGNPHIIFFVADLAAIDLARLGPMIEQDALFPERINVNVAQIMSPSHIRLAVWERAAGLTRACGTGACATAVAAIRRGLARGPLTVSLPGGDLLIDWRAGDRISMRGPATHVFTGEADTVAFA